MECAFVGAGAVARKYADALDGSPLDLAAVCDLDADRAAALADAHDATAYTDLDALLAAEPAELAVNLTSHAAHADVTETCLGAGRHVFSEKPLALDADRAADLVATAEERGLALGCAPITHRCDAQRHAASFLGDGRFGPIRLGYAHAHVGRVTEWHDSPDSFLSVGPLYDGAVYPLSLLVSWFGPVDRVRTADAVDAWPARESRTPDRPAHVEATLQFTAGPVIRLTASLYAPHRSREFNSLELHGDDGSLYLADSGALAADPDTVSVGGAGRPYVAAPHPAPRREQPYLSGPEHLAAAVGRGDAPTAGAERAAHVVAACNAIERAAALSEGIQGDSYDVTYLGSLPGFVLMAPADEAELVHMIATAVGIDDRPSALRYPRGEGVGVEMPERGQALEIGKGRVVREGTKVAVLSYGPRLHEAIRAADELGARGLSTTVADARFAKPLDHDLIRRLAAEHEVLITVEENAIGGFAAQVMQFLAGAGMFDAGLKMRPMTLPDVFIDHGKPEEQYEQAGLNAGHIVDTALRALGYNAGAATLTQKAGA